MLKCQAVCSILSLIHYIILNISLKQINPSNGHKRITRSTNKKTMHRLTGPHCHQQFHFQVQKKIFSMLTHERPEANKSYVDIRSKELLGACVNMVVHCTLAQYSGHWRQHSTMCTCMRMSPCMVWVGFVLQSTQTVRHRHSLYYQLSPACTNIETNQCPTHNLSQVTKLFSLLQQQQQQPHKLMKLFQHWNTAFQCSRNTEIK
jgi:hypothetical protein